MHNVSVRKRTLVGRPAGAGAVDCKRFTVGEVARGSRPGPQRKIRDARTYRPGRVIASSNRAFGTGSGVLRLWRESDDASVLRFVAHAVILAVSSPKRRRRPRVLGRLECVP